MAGTKKGPHTPPTRGHRRGARLAYAEQSINARPPPPLLLPRPCPAAPSERPPRTVSWGLGSGPVGERSSLVRRWPGAPAETSAPLSSEVTRGGRVGHELLGAPGRPEQPMSIGNLGARRRAPRHPRRDLDPPKYQCLRRPNVKLFSSMGPRGATGSSGTTSPTGARTGTLGFPGKLNADRY